jgi:hypothetical protein
MVETKNAYGNYKIAPSELERSKSLNRWPSTIAQIDRTFGAFTFTLTKLSDANQRQLTYINLILATVE